MSLRKLKRSRKQKRKATDHEAAERFFSIANDHKASGRLEKAVVFFRRTIQHNPRHGEAQNNLGNTLHLLGRLSEALPCYQAACELMDHIPQTHYNYGTALYEAGKIGEAIEELRRAIELDSDYAEAYSSLGVVWHAHGDLDQALAALKKAIRLKPAYQEAHRFLGLVMKDLGDIKSAAHQFSQTIARWPADAFTRYLLSRYKKYSSEEEAETAEILSQLKNPAITDDDAIFLHFTLGKIYDDLGCYQEAFRHYTLGNQKKRASFGKAAIATGIDLGRIRKVFTPRLFSRYRSHGSGSELPVFIVGMPRSGTTLVEQICASHSAVHGRGELKMIGELVEKNFTPQGGAEKNKLYKVLPLKGALKGVSIKGYPECLTTMNPAVIDELATVYLHELKENLPETITRITDKMPTNFIELGLIRLLFPGARTIHCVRNPLDTCLSNYFQNFDEGNECSFDLEELALYYRKYRELMSFWQETLPNGTYEIHYEKLVGDVEGESRKLIDFLGLAWEESCLAFFKTRRAIHTSSDYQVRQPIYSGSVQRWKNYEPYLGVLKKALASDSKLV